MEMASLLSSFVFHSGAFLEEDGSYATPVTSACYLELCPVSVLLIRAVARIKSVSDFH